MGEPSVDAVTWSIRLGRVDHGADPGERLFEELVERVPELLAQSFPPSCGYEAHGVRLSGPLDGVRWQVTRGPFRAELGLQRYGGGTGPGAPAATLRLVASATLCEGGGATDAEQLKRRVVGWATAGWGLGSVALAVLLLSLHGVGPVWAEALLLLPAVAVWRASVAGMIRRALPPPSERGALAAPSGGRSGALAESTVLVDGLRRWRELVPVLRAQYDLVQAATGQAPFRNPGHLATMLAAPSHAASSGVRGPSVDPRAHVGQGLAAGASPCAWPRPAAPTLERRQRSCSASTGKNDAYPTPESG